VVAKATAQTEAGQRRRKRILHGVGEAVASDEPESAGSEAVDSSGVLDRAGVALLAGSLEDAGGKVVSSDVEGGGGSALSKSGGNIGAEFGPGALCPALFAFSCSAAFFFSASASCNG